MALFKRADLEAQGMTKEQIDFVMTEGNRSLSKNYVLSSDVQEQINAAVEAAKAAPVNVKETDDYKALEGEFAAYKDKQATITSEPFEAVKPKFREQVYGMIQRGDGAEPVDKQLAGIREKYEEYFTPAQQQQKPPAFGAPIQGSMPTGNKGAVQGFKDTWGFGPKK